MSLNQVLIFGGGGLIGSACVRYCEATGLHFRAPPRNKCDVTKINDVRFVLEQSVPDTVILAVGAVGGIAENLRRPADFLLKNTLFVSTVLPLCIEYGVKNFVFFGSSCTYPVNGDQPYREESILNGYPEPSSLPYAVSKILGIHACLAVNRQYPNIRCIPVIPNSTYGPNDDFDSKSSHVLSALIGRFHQAKIDHSRAVEIWGSGTPKREFVYAEDVASAVFCLLAHESPRDRCFNIGSGTEVSIEKLASMVAETVGYDGYILKDTSKPNGAPRKLLDTSYLRGLGWTPKIDLVEGLKRTYTWYLSHREI